jgi:hypothetical protein
MQVTCGDCGMEFNDSIDREVEEHDDLCCGPQNLYPESEQCFVTSCYVRS